MLVDKIALEETHQFSALFLDYISQKTSITHFYNYAPALDNFEHQIKNKSFSIAQRETLHKVLVDQYSPLDISSTEQQNIDLLRLTNTFTITCGHQLNIFTGPLYFVFKIISVINLCKILKNKYPAYNFVPIYWMATEDHDFEEINHFYLFGKRQQWDSQQNGAVGEFFTDSMKELLNALPLELANFKRCYEESSNLSLATRSLIHQLFGQEGLLSLDANSAILKQQLIPIIKEELEAKNAFRLVNESTSALQKLGYKEQIHARECNLFWLDKNIRTRIECTSNGFLIKKNEEDLLELNLEEICKIADNEPEKFSPNVVLRPLYQEIILPNLSFTGGPAEIAYWLQLKSTFDHYKITFPILIPRSFGLIVSDAIQKKLDKYHISVPVLFQDDKIIKKLSVDEPIWLDFDKEKQEIDALKTLLTDKVKAIDPSLVGYIGAETNKIEKIIEEIEKRLTKAAEKKNEEAINQILNVKSKLFPDNGLQERHENIFTFKINQSNIIEELILHTEPLDFRFNIFYITN